MARPPRFTSADALFDRLGLPRRGPAGYDQPEIRAGPDNPIPYDGGAVDSIFRTLGGNPEEMGGGNIGKTAQFLRMLALLPMLSDGIGGLSRANAGDRTAILPHPGIDDTAILSPRPLGAASGPAPPAVQGLGSAIPAMEDLGALGGTSAGAFSPSAVQMAGMPTQILPRTSPPGPWAQGPWGAAAGAMGGAAATTLGAAAMASRASDEDGDGATMIPPAPRAIEGGLRGSDFDHGPWDDAAIAALLDRVQRQRAGGFVLADQPPLRSASASGLPRAPRPRR